MSVEIVITALVTLIVLFLGGVILIHNRSSLSSKLFSLFILSASVLTVVNYISLHASIADVLFWARMSIATATVYVVLFHLFIHNFPSPKRQLSTWWLCLVIGVASFFVVGILATSLFFADVIARDARYFVTPGPLIPIFGIFVAGFIIESAMTAIMKYKKSQGTEKTQWLAISIGTITTLLLLLTLNFIATVFFKDSTFLSYTPIFLLPMIVFTSYAILKYRLLNIKIIATEILSFGMVLILFIRTVTATNSRDILFNGITMVAMAIVSALLSHSVLREVRQKEELQIVTKELKKANEKLKQLDQAKTEFLSIAAHQLRTPLTGIKGYLDMILHGDLGEIGNTSVKSKLRDVFMQADRLARLVTVFLNVSRIEAGSMQMKYQKASMGEIIQAVIVELTAEAKRRNLFVQYVKPRESIPLLFLDRDKVHDVVMNLIDNALKYSKEGGVTVTVKLEPHAVQCVVSDTGMGIDSTTFTKLFQKFSRGEKGLATNSAGAGIGLYIARKIIETHGGIIWAESDGIGNGSRFIFELPRSLQSNQPVELVANGQEKSATVKIKKKRVKNL